MYKLGYIEGYDSYNSFSFSSISEQQGFFDAHVTLGIDAYYPPHYTNKIKLTSDDINISTPYNFVILEGNNGEYYYYFITNIRYINANLYEITIVMDTIQTYMFSTKIVSAIQTKECINRWIKENNHYLINRNYIRENISKGQFVVKDYQMHSNNKWALIQTSKKLVFTSQGQNEDAIGVGIRNNDIQYGLNIGYDCYLVPLNVRGALNYNITFTDTTQQKQPMVYSGSNYRPLSLGEYLDNPYVINIYILSDDYINSIIDCVSVVDQQGNAYIDIDYNSNNIDFTTDVNNELFVHDNRASQPTIEIGFRINSIAENIIEHSVYHLNYERNTSIEVNFNSKYVPQLIDENYMQLVYGERIGTSNTQLYESTSTDFKLLTGTDITEGSRIYQIKGSNDESFDKHTAIKSNLSKETLILINDAWKEYEARNKGNLSTGLRMSYANTIYNGARAISRGGLDYMGNVKMSDRYKDESNRRLAFAIKAAGGKLEMATGITDTIMGVANTYYDVKKTKENMEGTPDTVGQGNNAIGDLISRATNPFVIRTEVEDIETCGKLLENYGYTVNKLVLNVNLNNLDKNRYYYNVYRFENCELTFSSFVAVDIIEDIRNRLQEGIRLFDSEHVDNISEVLNYDNVERSAINE